VADHLGYIIEFSVGLAGFSAIVSAFIQRAGRLDMADKLRVVTLISMALMPAFVSFTYLGVLPLVDDPGTAVRACSFLFAVSMLVLLIYVQWTMRAVRSERPTAIHQLTAQTMLVVSSIFTVTLALMVIGWLPPLFVILYFIMIVTLLQAVVMFIRLLLGDRDPGR
jgi:hypothetical protein